MLMGDFNVKLLHVWLAPYYDPVVCLLLRKKWFVGLGTVLMIDGTILIDRDKFLSSTEYTDSIDR